MTRKEIREWASDVWYHITHEKKFEPLIELEGVVIQKGDYGTTVEVHLEGYNGLKRILLYNLPLRDGVTIGDTIKVKFELLTK